MEIIHVLESLEVFELQRMAKTPDNDDRAIAKSSDLFSDKIVEFGSFCRNFRKKKNSMKHFSENEN